MKVFIGSSAEKLIDKKYIDVAEKISVKLSESYDLVYGAAYYSIMGICYKIFKEGKKNIYAYTVEKYKSDFDKIEAAEEILLDTTFERSKKIYEVSDLLLIMPGGIGTLSELFSMLEESRSIPEFKPVIIFNYEGFYNKLLEFIDELISERFINPNIKEYYKIANSEDELFNLIELFKKEV